MDGGRHRNIPLPLFVSIQVSLPHPLEVSASCAKRYEPDPDYEGNGDYQETIRCIEPNKWSAFPIRCLLV